MHVRGKDIAAQSHHLVVCLHSPQSNLELDALGLFTTIKHCVTYITLEDFGIQQCISVELLTGLGEGYRWLSRADVSMFLSVLQTSRLLNLDASNVCRHYLRQYEDCHKLRLRGVQGHHGNGTSRVSTFHHLIDTVSIRKSCRFPADRSTVIKTPRLTSNNTCISPCWRGCIDTQYTAHRSTHIELSFRPKLNRGLLFDCLHYIIRLDRNKQLRARHMHPTHAQVR